MCTLLIIGRHVFSLQTNISRLQRHIATQLHAQMQIRKILYRTNKFMANYIKLNKIYTSLQLLSFFHCATTFSCMCFFTFISDTNIFVILAILDFENILFWSRTNAHWDNQNTLQILKIIPHIIVLQKVQMRIKIPSNNFGFLDQTVRARAISFLRINSQLVES